MVNVITFGTFDLHHEGHRSILKKASEYGTLYVGVSSDLFTAIKKGFKPIDNIEKRMTKIKEYSFVKEVFVEESMEQKAEYIEKYNIDILIMGDDWNNKFDNFNCKTIYLPRTNGISSTILKKQQDHPILSSKIKLNGTYNHPLTPSDEIFPLKKYTFYGYELYGPNKYTTMDNYYSKQYPMMEYYKIKLANNIKGPSKFKKYQKITNFAPAKYIRNQNFIGPSYCSKETRGCIHRPTKKYKIKNDEISINTCCKHHINDILLYTTELLIKNEIPYFVYWGSLLGCIRHKGSIPWDRDHDIYILDIYLPDLLKLIQEINKIYHFSVVKKNKFYRVNYSKKNKVHLDIYIASQM